MDGYINATWSHAIQLQVVLSNLLIPENMYLVPSYTLLPLMGGASCAGCSCKISILESTTPPT